MIVNESYLKVFKFMLRYWHFQHLLSDDYCWHICTVTHTKSESEAHNLPSTKSCVINTACHSTGHYRVMYYTWYKDKFFVYLSLYLPAHTPTCLIIFTWHFPSYCSLIKIILLAENYFLCSCCCLCDVQCVQMLRRSE